MDTNLDQRRARLMGEMIGARPHPPDYSRSYKSVATDVRLQEEIEVIEVVSKHIGAPLEKIYHPKAYEYSIDTRQNPKMFHDCMPLDAWDANHCLAISASTYPSLAMASSAGQEGLFTNGNDLRWLLRSFLCGIPINYVVYYKGSKNIDGAEALVDGVAILDFRVILSEGVQGEMKGDRGVYTAYDVWNPIK